jgi:hypothetical protein
MKMDEELSALDTAAIVFSIGGLLLYHAQLYFLVYTHQTSNKTQLGQMMANTIHWVKKHQVKEDPQSVTLAIQTLRNTILVAVFVGGNAISLGLNFSNQYSQTNKRPLQIRAILLTFLCFCSFLSWAMNIRFCSQVGYLIGTLNIPHEGLDDEESENLTASKDPKGKNFTKLEGGVSTGDIETPAIHENNEERIAKIKESQADRAANILILASISFR